MPKFLKSVVRNEIGMVESPIESARKLYDPLMRSSSISLIFFTPEVSRFDSTFISRFCDSEKFIDIDRPELGTPYALTE